MTFGGPCPQCGVRPDVTCRHREGDPTYSPPFQSPDAPKKDATGQGFNFKANARKIGGGGQYRRKVKK